MTAAMLRGEEIDTMLFCRLGDSQRRIFVSLGLLPLPGADPGPAPSPREAMGI